MRVAEEWAAQATREELKAHAAAIWQAMTDADRAAFSQFIGKSAIAAIFARCEEIDPDGISTGAAA